MLDDLHHIQVEDKEFGEPGEILIGCTMSISVKLRNDGSLNLLEG
jgi:hypothetical protein